MRTSRAMLFLLFTGRLLCFLRRLTSLRCGRGPLGGFLLGTKRLLPTFGVFLSGTGTNDTHGALPLSCNDESNESDDAMRLIAAHDESLLGTAPSGESQARARLSSSAPLFWRGKAKKLIELFGQKTLCKGAPCKPINGANCLGW